MTDDLTEDVLSELLPERDVRSYPALLSTQADAMAWAREGAAGGSVVVADYQAAPRGRAGLPWQVQQGEGLGFSLVLRPELDPAREGWLYLVTASAVADVISGGDERAVSGDGGTTRIAWPDEVVRGTQRVGAVGIHVETGPAEIRWAVASFLVEPATPPRGPLLAELVGATEERMASEPEDVLEDYRPRCLTLGMRVRARLMPAGPAGPQVVGTAVDLRLDGSIVIDTERGRVAVPPQNLGTLEEAL